MTTSDSASGDASGGEASHAERLAALERVVALLEREVAGLRAQRAAAPEPPSARKAEPPRFVDPGVADALRGAPANRRGNADESFAQRVHDSAALGGQELESLVGRYGTLALAGLIILMAVGAIIKAAVEKGLLTPEVRIVAGAVAAILLAVGGFFFRRRGDVRYGGVLLALSLAVVDLVAWGAGPRFHLVPTGLALGVVDVVAILLAALALKDGSEFLFAVAVAGALSAPFVTSDGGGTALSLLTYGGVVLVGALRSARDPSWMRAFAVLWLGAFAYAMAAASLPMSPEWYGAYLVVMFAGANALGALFFGEPAWKGALPRAYLLIGVIGMVVGWDYTAARPLLVTLSVALALAATTYSALLVKGVMAPAWKQSAIVLPFVSLGVAFSGTAGAVWKGVVLAAWTVFALAARRIEQGADAPERGAAHFLVAALLGCLAVTVWWWDTPLLLVAGLSAWGVVLAAIARDDAFPLALAGVALAVGSAALSSFDQLASRTAYSYTPFATRSSASAACATLGIGLAGWSLSSGRASTLVDRPLRLGALIGVLMWWGRMEVANAFNADVASFLLTSYYAACGVASIIVGRRLGIVWLRVAGLALALYAAFKAVVEVTEISSVPLRVGAYAAVGVFLLGAGYLYRDRSSLDATRLA